ncbi:MAG: hypothetical protein Q7S05_05315 [bacterium]|nr:hypothetical protein [bacterium]
MRKLIALSLSMFLGGLAGCVNVEIVEIERIRIINDLTIEVNLDAQPILILEGSKVANKPKGTGWVKVERRGEDLFVADKKVDLYVSERQKYGEWLYGYELRSEIERKSTLHPNVMDALWEHSHLVSDKYRKGQKGGIRYIVFWDVIFSYANFAYIKNVNSYYVRYFYWKDGVCHRDYLWHNDIVDGTRFAAVLAD